jgi:hypothetical protein
MQLTAISKAGPHSVSIQLQNRKLWSTGRNGLQYTTEAITLLEPNLDLSVRPLVQLGTSTFIKSSIFCDSKLFLLPASCWLPAWLILQPRRLRPYIPPKRRLPFNELHSVTSQKTELFITTAVETSNSISILYTLIHRFSWNPIRMNAPGDCQVFNVRNSLVTNTKHGGCENMCSGAAI